MKAMKSLNPLAIGALVTLCVLVLPVGTAMAQEDPRTFADTGYTVSDDAIWTFFDQYGGAATFGQPISREFLLFGKPTQIFQNAALQVQADGSEVQAMQLTDPTLLAASQIKGLTVPAPDAATAFVAPTPDQANYPARLQVFVQAVVREPFLSTFNNQGGAAVWGLPTSLSKADPNNPNFVYQRFQNGILFYDSSAGTTQALPLGAYLKTQLTSNSALLTVASTTNTDLSNAFQPDAV
jgi:hypothetical protein